MSNNHIPEEVYDNLVKTVHKYLPLLHRYTRLRQELLGIDDLKMYDLYTPLVKDVKFEMPYEEAKSWMLKALEPMGEEYLNVVKEGLIIAGLMFMKTKVNDLVDIHLVHI